MFVISADDTNTQIAVRAEISESQKTIYLNASSGELNAVSPPRRGQLSDWLSTEGYQLRLTGNAYQVKRRETLKPVTRRCYNVPTRTFSDIDQATRSDRGGIAKTLTSTATDV
jgi:hypothetical protein